MPYGKLEWGAWFYGLVSGFIGGGAGAVTSGAVVSMMDSTGHFVLGGAASLKLMGVCFLVNGAFSTFFYLKQHPLPDPIPDQEPFKSAISGKN